MIGNISLNTASLQPGDVLAQPAGLKGNRLPDSETPHAGTSVPAPPRSSRKPRMMLSIALPADLSISNMLDKSQIDMRKVLALGEDLHYHGSRSASLLAFTEYAGASKNSLLPMGVMLEKGIFPFCGEAGGTEAIGNSVHPNSFNAQHLSVVTAKNFGSAYDFGNSVNTATWNRDAEARRGRDMGTQEIFGNEASKKWLANADKLSAGRMSGWEKLGAELREAVAANFPVIYAIRPDKNPSPAPGPSVRGEHGLRGGATGETIKYVFVPDEKMQYVKDFFLKHNAPKNMDVQPFSSFRPDANKSQPAADASGIGNPAISAGS